MRISSVFKSAFKRVLSPLATCLLWLRAPTIAEQAFLEGSVNVNYLREADQIYRLDNLHYNL